MRINRYLFLMAALLCGMVARGQDDFNPANPPEPDARYRLLLKASPERAAVTSGTGWHAVNKNISVTAVATTVEWQFVNWTDEKGMVVNSDPSFTYTMSNKNDTLTANYTQVSSSVVTLSALPSSGGSVSGAGSYAEGKSIIVSCNNNSNYVFQKWTTAEGTLVSTLRSFSYIVPEDDVALVAHFLFAPGNPAEPAETKPKHNVYFSAYPTDAGYFNQTDGAQVSEEASFTVTAYNHSGWKFEAWEQEGKVISTVSSYTLTMGNEDVYLTARFSFSPGNPAEPVKSTDEIFTLYGNTVELYRGMTSYFPVYLENTDHVTELTFSVSVPNGIIFDAKQARTTSRTSGYTLTSTETAGEDSTLFSFTLSGGTQISEYNGKIIEIPVTTTSGTAEGEHLISFVSGIANNGETENALTFRPGRIQVMTLDESDLRAQFTFDRYLNRVQFTDLSSEGAQSLKWDFGDGTTSTEPNPMHIYAAAGTYNVTLTAVGYISENRAEQAVVINSPSTWSASGDYTLNDTLKGVRNFVDLDDAVAVFSQCKVDGNIVVDVRGDTAFTMNVADADALDMIRNLTQNLTDTDTKIQLRAAEAHPATLNWITDAGSTYLSAIFDLLMQLQCSHVTLQINGIAIDLSVLNHGKEQTVCARTATDAVNFSSIVSSERVTVAWEAVVKSGCTLSDYLLAGTGNLPAMSIKNSGTAVDSVCYHVTVRLDNTDVYAYIYNIYVRPLLTGLTLTYNTPADAVEVTSGNITLSWNRISSAESYTLFIERNNDHQVRKDTITGLTSPRYTLNALPGSSYTWYVTAVNECDELAGTIRTFTVRDLSNLTVSSVVAPKEAKGSSTVEITAVITNQGGGTTAKSGWYDALYCSSDSASFSSATRVTTLYHNGSIETGGSYSVTFTVTAPVVELGEVYYYVKTDDNNYESESDETDNIGEISRILLITNYLDSTDYESLKVLYRATNGETWSKPWKINAAVITKDNWPGVTFDNNGHVIAIRLVSAGLVGELPAAGFNLSEIETLNLSRNALTGDAALLVKGCPKLKSLDLSYNQLNGLSDTLSSVIISPDFGRQFANVRLSTLPMQNWEMGTRIENVVLNSLIAYDHSAKAFTSHPRLSIYNAADNSYCGHLSYSSDVYRLSLSGDYTLENNAELTVRIDEGSAAYSVLRASFSFIMGDANADKTIDLLDAQQTLNRILFRQSGNFNYSAANTYTDAVINVQDVVATVNLFIEENHINRRRETRQSPDVTADNRLYAENNKVYLSSEEPVAALDITLKGVSASQIGLQLARNRFQMLTRNTEEGVRLVIFSPTGDAIPAGETILLKMSAAGEISEAFCSDSDAQSVDIAIGKTITGVSDKGVSDEIRVQAETGAVIFRSTVSLSQCEISVYDVSGLLLVKRRWNELSPGENRIEILDGYGGVCIVKVKSEEIPSVVRRLIIK